MQAICCGCFKILSDSERKNIFDETLWISVDDYIENVDETKKQLKLSHSIELITGVKIVQSNEQSINLCDKCFQNIQLYINLRARLLHSFHLLNDRSNPIDEHSSRIECTKASQNQKDNQLMENVNSISDKISNKKITNEDVINVDESSTPSNFNLQLTDQVATDSINFINNMAELENDQENNNSSDLENCNNDSNLSICREIDLNVQDNDIESEIDVCSGEDEEVLELDDQSKRANIVEIDTSSESDIEVCDYEPIGKRIKNYHTFSPRLLF